MYLTTYETSVDVDMNTWDQH